MWNVYLKKMCCKVQFRSNIPEYSCDFMQLQEHVIDSLRDVWGWGNYRHDMYTCLSASLNRPYLYKLNLWKDKNQRTPIKCLNYWIQKLRMLSSVIIDLTLVCKSILFTKMIMAWIISASCLCKDEPNSWDWRSKWKKPTICNYDLVWTPE